MTSARARIALVATLAAAGLAIAALVGVGRPDAARGQTAEAPDAGITVTGTGTVAGVPDTADFTFGVETQGETSQQALQRNNAAVQRVIAALKNAGIAAADIQTQQVSVSPRYGSDGQQIVGFTATNSVNATVRDLSRAGAIAEAAVAAGANTVYGPTFSISSQSQLYKQALAKALEDARDKARAIAADAGLSLGNVTAIVEGAQAGPPVPLAQAAAGGEAGVPIEPGRQEITATLAVTFAIA
jgi:uncharacterized protein YggE